MTQSMKRAGCSKRAGSIAEKAGPGGRGSQPGGRQRLAPDVSPGWAQDRKRVPQGRHKERGRESEALQPIAASHAGNGEGNGKGSGNSGEKSRDDAVV